MRKPSDSPPRNTTEWAGGTAYGRSPPRNPSSRASIAGSPPQYRPPLEDLRGGFTYTSPPTSPRGAYRQPVSRASDYQSFGDYLGSSPHNRRPLSMQSQKSQFPPPPHHPQAHFYGAPDIDLGMPRLISEDRKTTEGCCCVLDNLPPSGREDAAKPEDVLLVGFDRGLDVYHLDKKRFGRHGWLDGLRGAVIEAKTLPFYPRAGLQAVQPLIAVIVHGPFIPVESSHPPEIGQVQDEEFDVSRSMMQAMHMADMTHYQTTVEIYSLKTGERIANLFQSPKVELRSGFDGQTSRPPPIGELNVQAHGNFLTVSSGTSGEVLMFEYTPSSTVETSSMFKCIGKVWTRTSSTNLRTPSTPSSDHDPGGLLDSHVRRPNVAILSLSDRWLAVVPPPSSSYTTLHGQTNSSSLSHKIPGLSSHTPPAEPQVTCELDMPKDASVLNRMARDVAQGALKGAQWVAAGGLQVFNNYWYKPSDQNQPAGSPPNPGFTASLPPPQNFPPTHAQDNSLDRARNQPTVVSILDLAQISQSQHLKPSLALQPIATFSLHLGCSMLSFSPSGLNLLTASAKGDVQQVWDLMRMVHGDTGHVGIPDAIPQGPNVRQIARFNRMTEANIIDVVWTKPRGDRFAIVTERGTVHINDLPPSAFQWPPYRRRTRSVTSPSDETKGDSKGSESTRPQSVGSTFGSALGMFTGKTQSAIASVRGRSPSANSGFSGFGSLAMTAGAGAKGGKVVAAGINRSVSAAAAGTVRSIRHYGENRLALPASPNPVSPGSVQWLHGRNQGSIAVIGGSTVRIHSIRQSTNAKVGQRRPSVAADRPVEFSLPNGRPSGQFGASPSTRPIAEASTSGSYWPPQPSRPTSRASQPGPHPLSYAEIETNAPYQPFHTDRRVNLFVYDEERASQADPHHLHDPSPWAFGEAIPATQIIVGSAKNNEDGGDAALPGTMENDIRIDGNVEDGQRIVSTTTWRKKSKKGEGKETGPDEGDFFEDDCEVLDYAENRV